MVEWKKLKEIVTFERGRALSKNDLGVGDAPIILYGELYTTYGDYINNIVSVTLQERARSATLLFYGDIVLPVSSTTKEAQIGKASVIKTKERVSLGSDAIILRNCQNASYLMYYLNSSLFERDKMSCVSGTTIMHLSPTKLAEKTIPIPSLEEQNRIVGILDTFTSAIDNLKEQIAQRRKQYEYYRDQLLDLEGKPGVEMKFITEVAKSFTGLTYKPENVSDSGTLVLRSSNINDDVLSFDDNVFVQMEIPERARVQENDILICVRNGSKRLVGKAAMITKEAEGMAFGAFMTILRSFAINSKFLFYVWQSEKVRRQYKGDEAMPIAQITAKDFQRIVIPVPPLSEQQRIVSILDTFEASIQNLEAQLKEREKQYEYYRNKLLTFE